MGNKWIPVALLIVGIAVVCVLMKNHYERRDRDRENFESMFGEYKPMLPQVKKILQ